MEEKIYICGRDTSICLIPVEYIQRTRIWKGNIDPCKGKEDFFLN